MDVGGANAASACDDVARAEACADAADTVVSVGAGCSVCLQATFPTLSAQAVSNARGIIRGACRGWMRVRSGSARCMGLPCQRVALRQTVTLHASKRPCDLGDHRRGSVGVQPIGHWSPRVGRYRSTCGRHSCWLRRGGRWHGGITRRRRRCLEGRGDEEGGRRLEPNRGAEGGSGSRSRGRDSNSRAASSPRAASELGHRASTTTDPDREVVVVSWHQPMPFSRSGLR